MGSRSSAPTLSVVLAGLSAYMGSEPSLVPIHVGKNLYHGNMEAVDKAIVRTLGALATVVALTYCHQNNRDFVSAEPGRSYVENVVLMMGRLHDDDQFPGNQIVQSLQRLWILFADHEMANSTSAFLQAASTMADPLSCCMAALASGSGPLHAGAIDMAYSQIRSVGTPDKVSELINRVKEGKQRLFGYGHRLYKVDDPRTSPIRAMISEISKNAKENPLLAVALKIDRVASKDEYFTKRNLKVNADLYGCFVYTALYVFRRDDYHLGKRPRADGECTEALNQLSCLLLQL